VLLILAGISIAMLTGKNGILTKATTAQEETKKTQYKEGLELIGLGLRSEQVIEQLSNEQFMDRYEEEIDKEIAKADLFKNICITTYRFKVRIIEGTQKQISTRLIL